METYLILRGNRITKEAANMWKYMYEQSKKTNLHAVPIPLHYFEKENFMLYREYSGDTLRDYAHDYEVLKKTSKEVAEKLAWWHTRPSRKHLHVRTEKMEKEYWVSVEKKIKKFLPKKYFSKKLSNDLNAIYTQQKSYNKTTKPTPTHNDFQASNILYDSKRKIVGIIDFGATTLFSPVNDVGTYMVHLAVMTNKYLTVEKTLELQKNFLQHYLKNIPKKLKNKTKKELPLYQARAAADIVATTAVALSHTNNPYRKIIPKMLIPIISKKMDQDLTKTRPFNSLLVQLQPYHE
jgi:aminoglycoside phosphotransferase (APT) family kinase protein